MVGRIAAYNANINAEIEAVLTKARELRERFGNFARLDHWIYRTVSGATARRCFTWRTPT